MEIVIDEEKAYVIEVIFKKYLELGSISKVKKILDYEGIQTTRGNSFTKQSIADILKNEFYKGVVKHSDIIKKGNHKPLVNKIIFGKVQAMFVRNKRNG